MDMKLLVVKVMLVITIISGGSNAQTNQMLSLSFPQQTILNRENCIGFSVTFTNNTGKTVYLLPLTEVGCSNVNSFLNIDPSTIYLGIGMGKT